MSEPYRVVQLDFIPEMEILYMLFERCHFKNRKRERERDLKHHIQYFNFRSKTQLDHPMKYVLV